MKKQKRCNELITFSCNSNYEFQGYTEKDFFLYTYIREIFSCGSISILLRPRDVAFLIYVRGLLPVCKRNSNRFSVLIPFLLVVASRDSTQSLDGVYSSIAKRIGRRKGMWRVVKVYPWKISMYPSRRHDVSLNLVLRVWNSPCYANRRVNQPELTPSHPTHRFQLAPLSTADKSIHGLNTSAGRAKKIKKKKNRYR